jgi:hypothetical protein
MSDVGSPAKSGRGGIGLNPFIGPRAIGRGEPIYGRGRETNDICSTLVAARIVLLYAVSGAGKTSLLEAGLRPELERRDFAVLPTVRVGYGVSDVDRGRASNRYTTLVSQRGGGQHQRVSYLSRNNRHPGHRRGHHLAPAQSTAPRRASGAATERTAARTIISAAPVVGKRPGCEPPGMHRDQRRSTGEPAAAIDRGGDREEEGS